jgi:hypothetical protein
MDIMQKAMEKTGFYYLKTEEQLKIISKCKGNSQFFHAALPENLKKNFSIQIKFGMTM